MISKNTLRTPVHSYFAVQIDVMNALHYRGNDGVRGTTLVQIITGKMKGILRKYLTGQRASQLRQVHLHIDDPTLVIAQKRSEQGRRDLARVRAGSTEDDDTSAMERLPDFNDELVVPWGRMTSNRTYKDELASLHLIFGAVAAEELASERKVTLEVFVYGGAFVLPKDFQGLRLRSMSFRRATGRDPGHFAKRVVIEPQDCNREDYDDLNKYVAVPRSFPVLLHTKEGLSLAEHSIQHGESETSFVISFNVFIKPSLSNWISRQSASGNADHVDRSSDTTTTIPGNRDNVPNMAKHACVVVSDDTDVFFILLLAGTMAGYNVIHVLNDSVHSVDNALTALQSKSSDSISLTTVYAFGGCDFLPGTNGIPHDLYVKSYLKQVERLSKFTYDSSPELYDTVMCIAYLFKHGMWHIFSKQQKQVHERRLMLDLQNGLIERKAFMEETAKVFACVHPVGSSAWRLEVRNVIADFASSLCDLVPPHPHIALQAARARFLVHHYWRKADQRGLSPLRVGGCLPAHGYDNTGNMLIENQFDVERLRTDIRGVITFCGCKGNCNNRRYSCYRDNKRCIGCKCAPQFCLNRIGRVTVPDNGTEPTLPHEAKFAGNTEILNSLSQETESDSGGDNSSSDGDDYSSSELSEDDLMACSDVDELLEEDQG